jgi:hypothetical protein
VQLAGTAIRVVLSNWFGAYLDKRELQQALPVRVYDEGATEAEGWFDYIADVGDGFHPTYTMAYLVAQPELTVDGVTLPRGRMLVIGGDEVYPTPSNQEYEDRMKGPYQAALPVPPPGVPQPSIYALPGNHDWYDGLTAFIRLFARDGKDRLGGWRSAQARSYFAIELPQRWWLFAIDTQFGAYIDGPQLSYFRNAAARLHPGDRVILCSPSPGWVTGRADPPTYDAIDYFVRTIIEPTGAKLMLMLSGDLHHYGHYSGPDRHLIHCGGGGAYLLGTDRLPERIQVPPPESLSRKSSRCKEYKLSAVFPSREKSRQYAAGVFARLPRHNPGFGVLLGLLHTLFMLAVGDIITPVAGTQQHLVTVPVALQGGIILALTTFLAVPPSAPRRRPKHYLFGLGHGIVHLALGVSGAFLWTALPLRQWAWPLPLLAAGLLYLSVFGFLAIEVFGAYLLIASRAGVNVNELYAGQAIVDAKCFLRMHIGPDGTLTVYPIAVDRICQQWTVRPDDPVDQPWLQPAKPIALHLAEPPIRI